MQRHISTAIDLFPCIRTVGLWLCQYLSNMRESLVNVFDLPL